MAKKPPRKPSNHVDADKVYNQLSADLFSALESANNENLSLASAAVKVAETLADPSARAKAENELEKLSKDLSAANKVTKSKTRKLILEHNAAKRLLMQERDSQIAALDASDKAGRAILKQDFKIKLVELENNREDRLASVLEDFTVSSEKLTESALGVIRELADEQDKAKQDYVSKLDDLLLAVDKAADDQRKEFEASRKRRSKAAKDAAQKPKSEEEELESELQGLKGNFLQRKVLRPLIGKALSSVTDKIQDLKDATGISAIQDLLESERARKDRLDEIRFELAAKRTASAVKASIEEERAKHTNATDTPEEEVRRTVSQIASDLSALRSASPLFSALSSNHVDDDHLLEFSSSTPNSLTASNVVANTTSNAARSASLGSVSDAYEDISDEVLREREVRALEALAGAQRRRRELGLMDYLMIGTVVAAGVYKTIDTFFDKVDIGAGVEKALTLVMKPFVWAYDGISKFITKTIPDTLSDIKGWLKSLYDKTLGRFFGGSSSDSKASEVSSRPASAGGAATSSAVPSFSPTLASAGGAATSIAVPSFSPSLDAKSSSVTAETVLSQAASIKVPTSDAAQKSNFQGASSLANLDDASATKVKARYASTAGAASSLVGSVSAAYEKATGKKPSDKELLLVMSDPAKLNSYMGEGFSEKYTKATGSSLTQQLFSLTKEATQLGTTAAGTPSSATSGASPTQVNKAAPADVSPVSPSSPSASGSSRSGPSGKASGVTTTPGLGSGSVMNYAITDPNGSVFLLTR